MDDPSSKTFHLFSDIPKELQTAILTETRESTIGSQRLSKDISHQTARHFIEQNIFNKPTPLELMTYLSGQRPKLFLIADYGFSDEKFDGYFHVFRAFNEKGYKYVHIIRYHQFDGTATTVIEEEDDPVTPITEIVTMMTKDMIYSHIAIDLMAMKFIINRRLLRFYDDDEVLQSATKTCLLRYLNHIHDEFNHPLLPFMFFYLYFNAILMGIDTEMSDYEITDQVFNVGNPNDPNGKQIAQDVNQLYNQLFDKIDQEDLD
ncbi:Hypothetical protein POVR1_LOCUS331 [uncultured virus]|nr:Hypothetical protein POVR1_LOCUS331 [uncultured virus]